MNDSEYQRFIEILNNRSHLFILGAGATMATIPNGDKNGLKSSVMANFLHNIGEENLLSGIPLKTKSNNIEEIYTELTDSDRYNETVVKIEDTIWHYFAKFQLPDNPTLYDFLILSLRSKDCIATFNWDPLLLQAYERDLKITSDLPKLLFLHGNVGIGLCYNCRVLAPLQDKFCDECGKPLEKAKLMYPVPKKDYDNDLFIRHNKELLLHYLKTAGILTIWGYGAPISDSIAKGFMIKAFDEGSHRLDLIEIIDIKEGNELLGTWAPFIKTTNHHIKIFRNLLKSLVGEFPRRSIEGYVNRDIKGSWLSRRPILKEGMTFEELSKALEPILKQERNKNFSL